MKTDLRTAREKADMSIQLLSQITGINKGSLGNMDRGKDRISNVNAVRLSRALETTIVATGKRDGK